MGASSAAPSLLVVVNNVDTRHRQTKHKRLLDRLGGWRFGGCALNGRRYLSGGGGGGGGVFLRSLLGDGRIL